MACRGHSLLPFPESRRAQGIWQELQELQVKRSYCLFCCRARFVIPDDDDGDEDGESGSQPQAELQAASGSVETAIFIG